MSVTYHTLQSLGCPGYATRSRPCKIKQARSSSLPRCCCTFGGLGLLLLLELGLVTKATAAAAAAAAFHGALDLVLGGGRAVKVVYSRVGADRGVF